VLLLAMAIVLLLSIVLGRRLGDRVLGGQIGRKPPIAGVIPTPSPEPAETGFNEGYWKHVKIISVATDPAFPDPRVTPPPEPTRPPTPKPTATPTPRPPSPPPPSLSPDPTYTSPPLPLPVVSHEPESPSPSPSAAASAQPGGGR
jgi:hypothetical protein